LDDERYRIKSIDRKGDNEIFAESDECNFTISKTSESDEEISYRVLLDIEQHLITAGTKTYHISLSIDLEQGTGVLSYVNFSINLLK
jgi:hypothetical protein